MEVLAKQFGSGPPTERILKEEDPAELVSFICGPFQS